MKQKEDRKKIKEIFMQAFILVFGFVMVYPVLWMIASAFKENKDIFTDIGLIPTVFNFNAFLDGWKGVGSANFGVFFFNSFKIVIPVVVLTVLSGLLVAYGFARFQFPGKKILFSIMIATLMLPTSVLTIPTYVMFSKVGWFNTYLPFIVPPAHFSSICWCRVSGGFRWSWMRRQGLTAAHPSRSW